MTPFDEFKKVMAEAADEVVEGVGPAKALSISEALAVRSWWDDRTNPNRHLPPHVRSAHCVEGVCRRIDPEPSLFDEEGR